MGDMLKIPPRKKLKSNVLSPPRRLSADKRELKMWRNLQKYVNEVVKYIEENLDEN